MLPRIKTLPALLALSALIALPQILPAQTPPTGTNSSPNAVLEFLGGITNVALVPYGTYAPDAPTKVGGGVLLLYNVNNYVGTGIGLDWLGQFSMVSGNVKLQLPTHPLSFAGLTNFTATPFVLGGIATPMGGAGDANGGLAGIAGGGAYFDVASLGKGWTLSVGAAVTEWTAAGKYSGTHYQGFLGLRRGF